MSKAYYAVLRLKESIEVTDVGGEKHKVKVVDDEVAGYLPVYHKLKAANKAGDNGKYKIVAIEEGGN